MCGIVGATSSSRFIETILLDGLKRLEYRGYDSAGIALLDDQHQLTRERRPGKIRELEAALNQSKISGHSGIAHTRWATHGSPSEKNAHPFVSNNQFAIVHNGIIENHAALRATLTAQGYQFTSETDSETIVHLLHFYFQQTQDIITAIETLTQTLEGAYALGILSQRHPDKIFAVRSGSPLVIGHGKNENFFASDPLALLSLTQAFTYLEEGDIAEVGRETVQIYNHGKKIKRESHDIAIHSDTALHPPHRHYMMQEIFAQPDAIKRCLENKKDAKLIRQFIFGEQAQSILDNVKQITLVACGTSYHAALVARYWIESIAEIACSVEIASEFRYRNPVVANNALVIFISQSGETADTLAALRLVKQNPAVKTLAICNMPQSSLVREAEFHCLTLAGTEIGVASTKAFTTQLVVLLLLTYAFAKKSFDFAKALASLPQTIETILKLDGTIKQLALSFIDKSHAIFLGRDSLFPIALEGALKLKEISYIHAEGYPAGELKHGPLALVDHNMPVIVLAPDNALFAKITSNLQEVHARGGKLFVFTDNKKALQKLSEDIQIIEMPKADAILQPILYAIPLQLLAYHVAVLKGTDVDQPRNLAKSVTVE
ncbi:MAG: glutamine--fructose-6-phosphate transaminase (isomerizing) [Gammaproteobacteria bacterium]|nr:glutamine--fructose-6-phosphate transaminase (isomerizing) [Gammaproteobacteria bacterium]